VAWGRGGARRDCRDLHGKARPTRPAGSSAAPLTVAWGGAATSSSFSAQNAGAAVKKNFGATARRETRAWSNAALPQQKFGDPLGSPLCAK